MKKIFTILFVILMLGLCVSCKKESVREVSLFDTVCTADEALRVSKNGSAVVFEGMKCTAGDDIWDEFYQKVSRGKPATVLCAHYYVLDKENVSNALYETEKHLYPKLFFYRVEYDGEVFTVTTRESTEKESDYQEDFKYLMHYTGDASAQASFSSYECYVLVDDQTVTWDEIMAGMVSSQSDAGVKHCAVYQNTFD